MKITNKAKLPDAVFNFISKNNYTPGANDYSVTTLLRPPQMVQLERRHWDALEEDAIDRVWSVFGHAVHNLLEAHAGEDAEAEQRLYLSVLGRTIGGQVDHYEGETITDYKVTSAWTLVYGSRLHEWEEQLNMYAHIFRMNNKPVSRLQIVAILRDWDKNKARQDSNYPQAPLQVINLSVWSDEQCEEYIHDRVARHIINESFADDCLQPCIAEEMWEQPTKYAVMKTGRKSALRVFDTVEEAEALVETDPRNLGIVIRHGKRTRCEDYCPVNRFCSQYKEYRENVTKERESEG
jgi:hypothetical protein